MKITSFEKLRDLSEDIQNKTEGDKISNPLGTSAVSEPIEGGLADFNKGTDVMVKFGNFYVPT